MATTFPTYPATTFEQAVELAIFSSNQLHNIINTDATSTVETEDGDISSVRKALVDNLYFKSPLAWAEGNTTTVFNQLYYFYQSGVVNGYYYAPTATDSNPVEMNSTPVGDDNWVLYSAITQQTPTEVYPYTYTATASTSAITTGYDFDTAIVTVNGVVLVPSVDYTITDSTTITLTNPIGVDTDTGLGDVLFAYLGKIVEGSGADYATYTTLAKSTGASIIGTAAGNTLQETLTNTTEQLSKNSESISNLNSSSGFSYLGKINSFSELRITTPDFEGQRILLSAWNKDITPYGQSSFGGGEFVAISGSATDDGGVIAKVSDSWYWKRIKNKNDLTVVDFGALPDGSTDSIDAAVSMYKWSQSNNERVGIVYPAGSFAVSSYDFSGSQIWHFRLVGAASEFGYFASTTLKLIGSTDSVAFKVKSRYMEIGNLLIQNGLSKDTVARGFYKNTITAGQYNRIKCIYADTLYGKVFDMQDTLDTKIDQLYSQYCTKNILSVIMSGDSNGSWDHSTAIELTNVNIQYHAATSATDCALFMPRCTQSIMRNVWIEHSSYPGNISEGSWTIDNLCMEYNNQPMYAQWLRCVNEITDFQGSNSYLDFTTGEVGNYNGVTRPDWATSSSEQGRVTFQTSGISIDGYLATKYQNSRYRISNNTANPAWYRLGIINQPVTGDQVTIKILASRGSDVAVQNPTASSTNFGGGAAYIDIQSTSSTSNNSVSWYGEGSCPIYDVKFQRLYPNQYAIYVQLGAWVSSCGIFLEISGQNRSQSGTPTTFAADLSLVADITTVSNIQPTYANFVIGNGKYGFGMNITTGQLTFTGSDAALSKIPIIINGTQRYITVTSS